MMLLLWACAGEEAAKTRWGAITADRAGETGWVDVLSAYGFDLDGEAIVFLSGGEGLSCADATAGLSGGTESFDPSLVRPPGSCTVFLSLDFAAGAGADEAAPESPTMSSVVSTTCAMDTGTWAYLEAGEDEGWVYSGPLWQGAPQRYEASLTGGGGGDYELTLSMDTWDGDFLYEELAEAPASGLDEGTAAVTWCPDFEGTAFF